MMASATDNKDHAKAKGMSVNQLVISLLEKDMGIEIVTVREQNKQNYYLVLQMKIFLILRIAYRWKVLFLTLLPIVDIINNFF